MSDQLIRKLENANAWMEKLKKRNDELEAENRNRTNAMQALAFSSLANGYADRIAKLTDQLANRQKMVSEAKKATFLPDCKWQQRGGSVICDNIFNELYGQPCTKRCTSPEPDVEVCECGKQIKEVE